LAPQNTLAYANLGYASYWSNDCDKAMPAFNKAIELDANHAESGHWHSLAGMCYIRLKDYTNAERYCEKALFLLPAQPRGALCLGKAQFGAKQYEAAISSFLRAYNMTTDSFYKGESQDGVLASLSKQNRLDLAANLLKLTPESLWTKEFIEKSATKAVSSLEHGERWQY
jgi:tetratricopeptide (TPR) repeat protein